MLRPEGAHGLVLCLTAAGVTVCLCGLAERPRTMLRRDDAVLLPEGLASAWWSPRGRERLLHLRMRPAWLAMVAERTGMPGREGDLRPGLLPADPTLAWLLRQVLLVLREGRPGADRFSESAIVLVAAQMLAIGARPDASAGDGAGGS